MNSRFKARYSSPGEQGSRSFSEIFEESFGLPAAKKSGQIAARGSLFASPEPGFGGGDGVSGG